MQLSHTHPVASARFDEPNLVSSAGLVPLMAFARKAGLRQLGDRHLSVPSDKGSNAGVKLASIVAGMAAGADSIDDMALLRHGGMGKIFDRPYAPSTLGSFLREFTFGHVRQADAVASRFLMNLATNSRLLGDKEATGAVMVDIDDTIFSGPRLCQAGRVLRLQRGSRPQWPTGHGLGPGLRASDRCPTPT